MERCMTESRTYVAEVWFACLTCGTQITNHTMHRCSPQLPEIAPQLRCNSEMKPTAYISDSGVLFKELPPNPMFNLFPLYPLKKLSDKEIEEIATKIFNGKEGYEFCDVYRFAMNLLREATDV